METGSELGFERPIDQLVPCDAGLSLEGTRHENHLEVGLGSGFHGVVVALVEDLEVGRSESFGEGLFDSDVPLHWGSISMGKGPEASPGPSFVSFLSRSAIEIGAQSSVLRREPQLSKGFRLDLTDSLTREREALANLFQGVVPGLVDPET